MGALILGYSFLKNAQKRGIVGGNKGIVGGNKGIVGGNKGIVGGNFNF